VQLHQQKGMISLSPPTICNSAEKRNQTILAAKEKNPLRWRTGKVRIYDALPVSMSCRPLSKAA
ncbi:hypothetical protein, partial [Escherichia coli]